MNHCIICPTSDLRKFAVRSNYHLALAHIVEKSPEYRDFYMERSTCGDTVILDNSSYEIGDGIYSPSDLVGIAKKIGATEIMAPEVFKSGNITAIKILEFSHKVGVDINVFGVVHGTTIKELCDCFKSVYQYVNTIGFSCRLEIKDFEEYIQTFPFLNESAKRSLHRFLAIRELSRMIDRENLETKHIKFHLLGLNHLVEFLWYGTDSKMVKIRSCDSSCAYLNGYNGIDIGNESLINYSKPIDYMVFDNPSVSPNAEKLIHNNITCVNKLMEFGRRSRE